MIESKTTPPSDLSNQVVALLALDDPSVTFEFDWHGFPIPVRFKRGNAEAQALIISFHGAVDRATREVPAFIPFMPELSPRTHQLSVSDPTIMLREDIAIAWYAGFEGFDLQTALRAILAEIIVQLAVKRPIFFGTSGGGFAALFQGWHVEGSVMIVGNPQTDILKYYDSHKKAYLETCWPQLDGPEALSHHICTNVCALYSKKFAREVIYVQSTTDEFHTLNHMLPFVAAARASNMKKLILESGFWGKFTHGPTPEAYRPWLHTVAGIQTANKNAILESRKLMDLARNNSTEPAPGRSRETVKGTNNSDIQISDAIREWQLDTFKS